LHGGRSLQLADGSGGRLLVICWAGCNRRDVLAELRRRGVLDRRGFDYQLHTTSTPVRDDGARRTARALNLWRNSEKIAGSIVARYLAHRGIVPGSWPSSLRFHPRCPRPRDNDGELASPLPAMVALAEHCDRGPVAVHCTYLLPDGSGKAEIQSPKVIFGPVAGAAVRFGTPRIGQWLAVAEGVETALTVAIACSMPAWAALSAGGIKSLVLPPEASQVVICADHDDSGTGERVARDAAARWLAEGRQVRIAIPPELSTDFNDVLTGRAVTKFNEALDVA
jgi:hypothetical protein